MFLELRKRGELMLSIMHALRGIDWNLRWNSRILHYSMLNQVTLAIYCVCSRIKSRNLAISRQITRFVSDARWLLRRVCYEDLNRMILTHQRWVCQTGLEASFALLRQSPDGVYWPGIFFFRPILGSLAFTWLATLTNLSCFAGIRALAPWGLWILDFCFEQTLRRKNSFALDAFFTWVTRLG